METMIQKINSKFEETYINIFKQHLYGLNINYESKFKINTDGIYNNTLNQIRIYINYVKDIIIDILNKKLSYVLIYLILIDKVN